MIHQLFRHYFYITKISSKHPDADTLYVEKIDVGDPG